LTGLLAIGITDSQAAENTKYRIKTQPKVSDFYPAISVANGEQGRTIIKICWNKDGKVVDTTLVESSGIYRLDEAAVLFGKAYVFRPGIENDVPVAGCAMQAVQFSLARSPPR